MDAETFRKKHAKYRETMARWIADGLEVMHLERKHREAATELWWSMAPEGPSLLIEYFRHELAEAAAALESAKERRRERHAEMTALKLELDAAR